MLWPSVALVAFFLFLTGRHYYLHEQGLVSDDESCGCFGDLITRTSPYLQAKGITRLLMQKLLDIARNRNLEVMEGQVLANNYRMLELMSSMGFKVENDREDSGIKVVSQRLN